MHCLPYSSRQPRTAPALKKAVDGVKVVMLIPTQPHEVDVPRSALAIFRDE
jgi:hypothetical protein